MFRLTFDPSCLLDSVLPDHGLRAHAARISLEAQSDNHRQRLERYGHAQEFIDSVLSNFEADVRLAAQPASCMLKWTRLLLFKALVQDPSDEAPLQDRHAYVASLPFNNFERVHTDISFLTKVELADAHDFDILARDGKILPPFFAWTKPSAALQS